MLWVKREKNSRRTLNHKGDIMDLLLGCIVIFLCGALAGSLAFLLGAKGGDANGA